MKQKKKIALIWANPYNKNFGVSALAYSALYLLSSSIDKIDTEADIYIIGSSKVGNDTIKIRDKNISFQNIHGLDYFSPKSLIKLLLWPHKYKINTLRKLDFVFDVSEGDSFSDIYGGRRFNRITNSKRLFNKLGIKQILLPQTIGPFKSKSKHELAIKAMSKMEKVISRDKISFDFTAEYLANDKAIESIDLAFLLAYNKIEFNSDSIHCGINISGLLWDGGYTGQNQFDLKSNYQNLIRKSIEFFISKKNTQVHLVPHVIPDDSKTENDYEACKLLKNEYPEVILPNKFENPVEAKSYIAGLDYFTGARMHSCIAAYSSGVPVFPMAYSRKFNGLFKDTLKYDYIGDCTTETEDVILKNLEATFNQKDNLKIKISESLNEIVTPRLRDLEKLIMEVLRDE